MAVKVQMTFHRYSEPRRSCVQSSPLRFMFVIWTIQIPTHLMHFLGKKIHFHFGRRSVSYINKEGNL